jgi:MFS family permease
MTRLERATRDTFRSLRSRNYRLFFFGQIVSVSGTWMQGVAQAWLVLQLTGSGTALGLTTGLQFLPILIGGPWAGVLADRVDKRRLLLVTQSTAALLAIGLGVLTATGVITLWMVLALAFAFGCVVAVDNPARQSFLMDMVGPDDVPNAVTLNSVVINAARGIGPAIGGALIAGVGLAACFLLNGLSYVAVLIALVRMRPAELHGARRTARAPRQLREGLAYVWRTPTLRVPLLVMAMVGTLAYEFHVTLPLLAKFTFAAGPMVYGVLSAVMGLGAVIGGLASARRTTSSAADLVRAALIFGALILAVAAAPTLPLVIVGLFFVGTASIRFIATANATLQVNAAPHMRGRVMALWGVAFLGSTPLGGPLIGWVGETFGARAALAVGGVATIAVALWARGALRRGAAGIVGDAHLDTAAAAETEAALGAPIPGGVHGRPRNPRRRGFLADRRALARTRRTARRHGRRTTRRGMGFRPRSGRRAR